MSRTVQGVPAPMMAVCYYLGVFLAQWLGIGPALYWCSSCLTVNVALLVSEEIEVRNRGEKSAAVTKKQLIP